MYEALVRVQNSTLLLDDVLPSLASHNADLCNYFLPPLLTPNGLSMVVDEATRVLDRDFLAPDEVVSEGWCVLSVSEAQCCMLPPSLPAIWPDLILIQSPTRHTHQTATTSGRPASPRCASPAMC